MIAVAIVLGILAFAIGTIYVNVPVYSPEGDGLNIGKIFLGLITLLLSISSALCFYFR